MFSHLVLIVFFSLPTITEISVICKIWNVCMKKREKETVTHL